MKEHPKIIAVEKTVRTDGRWCCEESVNFSCDFLTYKYNKVGPKIGCVFCEAFGEKIKEAKRVCEVTGKPYKAPARRRKCLEKYGE